MLACSASKFATVFRHIPPSAIRQTRTSCTLLSISRTRVAPPFPSDWCRPASREQPLRTSRGTHLRCVRVCVVLYIGVQIECSLIPGKTRDSNASGRDVKLGCNIGTVPTRSGRLAGMLLHLTNYNTYSIWLLLMHSHVLLSGVCIFGFSLFMCGQFHCYLHLVVPAYVVSCWHYQHLMCVYVS